ncbi:unnamed protein product [Nippostrongylus brasiliensis]|uniref:Secreted protein n=1 Tax=Nippostrongylus brasiliensis TaxID=27835 RepID=A0A0N4YHI9_NIPBR|nr:unnamed protein product [Nippostrongylus brasiliensis]
MEMRLLLVVLVVLLQLLPGCWWWYVSVGNIKAIDEEAAFSSSLIYVWLNRRRLNAPRRFLRRHDEEENSQM